MSQVLPQSDYVHKWGNIEQGPYKKPNTKTGWLGVELKNKKYHSRITVKWWRSKTKVNLGTFVEAEQAAIVYAKARQIQTPVSSDPKPQP